MVTPAATGPTPPLAGGTGVGQQVGDGNVSNPIMYRQGPIAAYTGAVTLTTDDLKGGLIGCTLAGGAANFQLPLATDLDTALPNAGVNDAFDFSVQATTNTATITTNTGWTLVGAMTVAASTVTRFRARKTAAGAWTLYRWA